MQIREKVKQSRITKPAKIYLFGVSDRNTRKRCEISLNSTIKTPERRQCFIVNSEHVNISWEAMILHVDSNTSGELFTSLTKYS